MSLPEVLVKRRIAGMSDTSKVDASRNARAKAIGGVVSKDKIYPQTLGDHAIQEFIDALDPVCRRVAMDIFRKNIELKSKLNERGGLGFCAHSFVRGRADITSRGSALSWECPACGMAFAPMSEV